MLFTKSLSIALHVWADELDQRLKLDDGHKIVERYRWWRPKIFLYFVQKKNRSTGIT